MDLYIRCVLTRRCSAFSKLIAFSPPTLSCHCSKSKADFLRQLINDSQSFPSGINIPPFSMESGPPASQVLVMGPDDYIVAVVR